MDQMKAMKQMIDFNKAAFDNSFNAMVMLQEQAEKMVDTFLDQAAWLPEDGNKVIREWVKTYKDGCKDFRKAADDNFKKVENYFASSGK